MSIKVYEAYRVARGTDPFDLLWDIKRRAQAEARAKLAVRFHDILDGKSHTNHLRLQEQDKLFKAWLNEHHPDAESRDVFRLYGEWGREHCPDELRTDGNVLSVSNEEVLRAGKREVGGGVKPSVFDVDMWMMKKYGEQLTNYQRNPWALDVAVTMRRYRNRFYLVPYCDRACLLRGTLDFMAEDERLEDFSYWNNTDPPDEVSSQQWAWRGTVWNDLTEHERWSEHLTLDIVSWMGWNDVSPALDVARSRNETDL